MKTAKDIDGLEHQAAGSSFEHAQRKSSVSVPMEHAPLYGDKLEPVAVVGISLKFPQDANNLEGFWDTLINARSAMTEVPEDRYNLDAFYNEDSSRSTAFNVRGGHYLKEDIAGFDAPFFNINAQEAACMDPQQRGLLECSYRALENAGVPISQASKSNTSVYIGSFSREYEAILMRDPEMQAKYMGTGTGTSMLANRLSWFYDFRGPSIAIDTACSSSLIAVHLATQSLRCGESEMAVVGGCNLFYNPDLMIPMTNLNFLSADSRCYSFDHRANGYSRGEGFGVVVLKTLSAALRDRNMIRAIIRATGTNQDGRTPGITQPSSEAQQDLIRATYRTAGLDLKTTRFFEAHGTGTPTGDPLEARAIGTVFGPHRSPSEPLIIGAVKSNIGHLEGASGIAGLIKSILVLENGLIPPNINFEKPNPKLKLGEWNIKFPLATMPWPTPGIRRASINSFGFGGSNSHVVIEDALNYLHSRGLTGHHCTKPLPSGFINHRLSLERPSSNISTSTKTPRLAVFSAADENGVQRQREAYVKHLDRLSLSGDSSSNYFENLLHTLSEKRTAFSWRGFTIASNLTELAKCIEEMPKRPMRAYSSLRIAFVFTGQGAQWIGMGKDLMVYPSFRKSVEAADEYLAGLGSMWSVQDVIRGLEDSPSIDRPDISQTTCTVLQVALIDLLEYWNIHPAASIGHSSGEIAAAYSSGLISRSAAWRIAFSRGIVSYKAQELTNGTCTMMAVGLGEHEIFEHIQTLQQGSVKLDITIACINSARSITLSGQQAALEELSQILTQSKIFHRMLRTGNAYHSHHMRAVADMYRELMVGLETMPKSYRTTVSMYSTVTGHLTTQDKVGFAGYWVENLVSPVQFLAGLNSLVQENTSNGLRLDHFLEIGPGPALRRSIQDIVTANSKDIRYIATLQPKEDSHKSMLQSAGSLYAAGYPIDLGKVNSPDDVPKERRLLVDLPEYTFNHANKYWLESRISKEFRFRTHATHELLGTRVKDFNPLAPRWRTVLRQHEIPWVVDHRVNNTVLYPASGMLVMAIEAIRQLLENESQDLIAFRLKDVRFLTAMNISEGSEGLEVNTSLLSRTDKASSLIWYAFEITSYTHGQWQTNCKGLVGAERNSKRLSNDDTETRLDTQLRIQKMQAKCQDSAEIAAFYQKLDDFGYGFGPTFRTLSSIKYDHNGNATGSIGLKDWTMKTTQTVLPHLIHPTALDAIIQSTFPALSAGGTQEIPTLVPTEINEMWLSATLLDASDQSSLKVMANSTSIGLRETLSQVDAHDNTSVHVWIRDLHATIVSQSKGTLDTTERAARELAFRMQWQPDYTLMTNENLQEYCSRSVPAPTAETSARVEEIETACFIYLRRTFVALSKTDIVTNKPHLVRYYDWIEHQLNRLSCNDLLHKSILSSGILGDNKREDELLATLENGNPEARLCARVGQHLTSILNGQEDALALIFENSLIDEYYTWCITGENKFQKATNLLDLVTHKDPGMRILEIGAGTGSGTDAFLNAISPQYRGEAGIAKYSKWTFTDISPAFFEKARDRFVTEVGRMDYKVFDASQDPTLQGFETGSHDLILAVNVIHATPDIVETLRHTRSLLRPGGKLMLLELCNTEIVRSGFIFGLLSGWWAGIEPERKWSPLLSEADWSSYLVKAGFSGMDIGLRDAVDAHNHCGTLIVSTRVEPVVPNGYHVHPVQKMAIIADPESSLQQQVAHEWCNRLMLTKDFRCEIVDPDVSISHEYVIYLPELETPVLTNLSDARYTTLKRIAESSKLVIWVGKNTSTGTSDPSFGTVQGWARCVRSEYGNLQLVTLALEEPCLLSAATEKIFTVFNTSLTGSAIAVEEEYEERNSILCIPRISQATEVNMHVATVVGDAEPRPLPVKSTDALELAISTPGILSTIHFAPAQPFAQALSGDEVEIEVSATGLNYHDLIVLLGRHTSDYIGVEFAGVIRALPEGYTGELTIGSRVCGIAPGTYKNTLRTKQCLVVPIPEQLSSTQGAAYPLAFWTAYYSIIEVGHLGSGDKILIHSGAGGVGQAAIQLAKLRTPVENIFVTVGSDIKKDLLVERYGLPARNILHTQSVDFSDEIKLLTGGHGVDLVLNSLGGEALRRSLDCVAPFGHFVEIGMKDVANGTSLPMKPFADNINFSSVNLDRIMRQSPARLSRTIQQATILLRNGLINPQVAAVYTYSKLEDAFHHLQTGKSLGKLVAEIRDNDKVMAIPTQRAASHFDRNSTYVISGMGGLGRSMALWMVDRGCRNLLLLSRSGDKPAATSTLIAELQEKGVRLEAPPCDVSDSTSLTSVLKTIERILPPIKGCIQGAMVLRDGILENLSLADFNAALAPKIAGSWNLHNQLPSGMDFFILLSSLNGIMGTRGQCNYGAGNTYQDALAKYRVNHGEKATVVDLGKVNSIGYVAENTISATILSGYSGIEVERLLGVLDYYCDPTLQVTSPDEAQIMVGIESPAALKARGEDDPWWAKRAMCRILCQMEAKAGNKAENTLLAAKDYQALVKASSDATERLELVLEAIKMKLSKVLSAPAEDFDDYRSMNDYGTDSLVAVEIKNWIQLELMIEVAVFEILAPTSMKEFCQLLCSRIPTN